ncbi:MAG: ABC transporter substrate-binding protein [Fimbriimonadaceae bacterium]|nr:ABC transporter substrate-binding protein [Fimbriimonadaceae bacterium]
MIRQLLPAGLCALAISAFMVGCKPAEPTGTTGTGSSTPSTSTSAGTTPATAARTAPEAPGNEITGDTIKIGLVASQNGELRPWGIDTVSGAKLAEEEVNAAGGINGKKIQVMVGDSASNPQDGKNAAQKLIADGAVVVLGEVASGITAQMNEVAYEKGVPLIAIGATRTDLAQKGNFFRVCYTDDFQGPVMAAFAYRELNLRRVAIMTDRSTPYSTGLSDSFRKKFTELGGEIVTEEFYQSKETQFTAQLTNVKGKTPDGIFMSGYFPEVGPMARQIRDIGMKDVKLLGGDGWDSTELTSGGGDAIIGGFFCNHYNNQEPREEVKKFLAAWNKKYATTPGTTMGALGYDATMLAVDAIRRATTPNSKGILEALEATENFMSVSGKITLKGNNGNPPKRALVVEVSRTGQVFRKAYEPGDL